MATPNYPEYTQDRYPIKEVKALNIAIIYSEWNSEVIDPMMSSCIDSLKGFGIEENNITSFSVPGSYELPLGAKMVLGSTNKPDAVICLGCVIQGETKHDDYINHTIARGLAQLGLLSGKPVIYGVITTNNLEQAKERAGGAHGNKGSEAAQAALKMISLKEATSLSAGGKISF
ncbi:MAG: 6,7-dimethyl-8-ribityllumazine synthase [Bacteroidota bacterium]